MPATETAVAKKQEKSKTNRAEAEGAAAQPRKSSRARSGSRGNKRSKEEAAQRKIVADCVALIDESMKWMAREEEEIRRLREETRAILSRL